MRERKYLPTVKTGLILEHIQNQIIVYNKKTGETHLLNEQCAQIFNFCKAKNAVSATCKDLADRLNISEQAAQAILDHALVELQAAGLLQSGEQICTVDELITRRGWLKAASLGVALLPAISTVLTPLPADAASTITDSACMALSDASGCNNLPCSDMVPKICTTGGAGAMCRCN